ncbi:MAG: helix-turn-helix domain-containing protein [Phycisphaerae bacterium]|nr:helix-turn-helix domain-containing protein [Phycisphaerae bacterium]
MQKLIDVNSVAELLGVAPRTIWKLVSKGGVPAPLRLGRSVRWRSDELSRWVESGCPDRDRWEAMKREIGGAK